MITLQKIEQALRQYRPRFSLTQRFETRGRSNFLNFIKKIDGENGTVYVMKVPKLFTDIICYLRIAIFHILGDKAIAYGTFAERMKNEKEKIKLLNEKGVPSLPLVNIEVDGALVTRFVRGGNLKDIFYDNARTLEEKLELLAESSRRLEDIHTYFSHGDAQIRNILLAKDNEIIWVDYEYIASPEAPVLRQRARDLVFLVFSAVKHLTNPDVVVETILDAYKGEDVKKSIPSLRPYLSIGYNLFLNLLNPVLCVRARKVLRKILQ